jgi:hypothetical protein
VPLDRDQVARDWRQRGYSCDVFTDPPCREWNDFVHATNELVTVMIGKLRLTIDAEETLAEPGDEVLGVCHSVKNISSSTTHWLYGYDQPTLSMNAPPATDNTPLQQAWPCVSQRPGEHARPS